MSNRIWVLQAATVLLLLLAAGLAYSPGLSGGFALDDFHNIVENKALQPVEWNLQQFIEAATSTSAGRLGRPVATFTFALDAWWHGLDPSYMKAVNLFLHGLTGLLVFLLARQIIPIFQNRAGLPISVWPALLAAAVWMLHPIQISAVLYVVQRMAILAALFGCLSVLAYLRARQAPNTRTALFWLAAHLGTLLLAAFSKENGLLIAPLILILEASVLRFKGDWRHLNHWVRGYVYAIVASCILAGAYLVLFFDSFVGGYTYREFSLLERVLTEPRVLWHYIGIMLVPIPHNFSLYLDGFPLSSSLLQPTSTLLAIGGLLGVLVWAIWRCLRGPSLLAFGALWFLVAHAFESTVFPLEIAFEHRNYFPSVGLAIAACGALSLGSREALGTGSRALISTLVVGLLAACTYVVATYWADPLEHALISVEHNPQSPRAHYSAGTIYFGIIREQGPVEGPEDLSRYIRGAKQAEFHFKRAAELAPNAISPLIQQIILFGDVPESARLLDALHNRLAATPLQPASGEEMYQLIECFRRGECPLDDERLLAATIAATDNPHAPRQVRTTFHLLAASLLAREFDDREEATRHIEKAQSLMPDNRSVRAHVGKFYESAAP